MHTGTDGRTHALTDRQPENMMLRQYLSVTKARRIKQMMMMMMINSSFLFSLYLLNQAFPGDLPQPKHNTQQVCITQYYMYFIQRTDFIEFWHFPHFPRMFQFCPTGSSAHCTVRRWRNQNRCPPSSREKKSRLCDMQRFLRENGGTTLRAYMCLR